MSTVRILICDPIDPEGIEKLKKASFNVAFLMRREMLKKEIQDCDVLIVRSRTKVTREIIESGKHLKLIARAGSGLDNIDLKAAEEKGIAVINTPEASADSVAELTIGLMVALARKMILADSSMKQGKWLKKELMGFLLKGKKLGLIGLGNIGLRVARIAKAMGMKILVTKRVPPSPELLKSLEAEFLPLDELLRQSDIVSIHVPLSKETRNMIDAEEIGKMKDGAFLINTSRGEIVNEKALLNALRSGKLGGAALDVYSVEPPENLELIKRPNVICTPHIGAQTVEAQREASIRLAEKIIRFLHGSKSNSS
ncbi:3-phosphoglycerate dehydrogenase [Candidatus Bathyarchaeota archaeon]|nr:MAG: 3-phosphoglycerate dehydrogenase [Candidatus Bathyarchaeota archaeon]